MTGVNEVIPSLPKHVLELLARDDGIPAATPFSFVKIDTGIAKAGVFVSLELVNGIVHEGVVKYTKRDKQVKVLLANDFQDILLNEKRKKAYTLYVAFSLRREIRI